MITWAKVKNWLSLILGLLVGFLLFRGGKSSPGTKEAEKTLTEAEKTAGEIIKTKKEREKEAAKVRDRLNKITTGTLILILLIGLAMPVRAEAYIPETYDEAIRYYLAAVEVAQDYQRLYESAEVNLDRALEQNQALAGSLRDMIQYKQRFGINAGLLIYDYKPGLYVGLTYTF